MHWSFIKPALDCLTNPSDVLTMFEGHAGQSSDLMSNLILERNYLGLEGGKKKLYLGHIHNYQETIRYKCEGHTGVRVFISSVTFRCKLVYEEAEVMLRSCDSLTRSRRGQSMGRLLLE